MTASIWPEPSRQRRSRAHGLDPADGNDTSRGVARQRIHGVVAGPAPRPAAAAERWPRLYGIAVHREPVFSPALPGIGLSLRAEGGFGDIYMDLFQRALATRFGVTPRFIQVRLQHYGLLNAEAAIA